MNICAFDSNELPQNSFNPISAGGIYNVPALFSDGNFSTKKVVWMEVRHFLTFPDS